MPKILMLAFAVALWTTCASAQTIGGRYTVQGTNPDGSAYGGPAEIVLASDGSCRMLWNTGSTFNGTCVISGQSLSAIYQGGDSNGTANYQLQPDSSLQGTWTMGAGNGTETLIPVR
jgi:hypothetical protein